MEPLVSVIVPVYKVEEYLPRCLESIVHQSYRNLEIILVDDGSPDGCGPICDSYAAKDSRIRVIHQENSGVSAARNAGLDCMSGEIVMFVDSDDWMSPDAVQVLYDRLIYDGSDMAIGQVKRIWDNGHLGDSYCGWLEDMVITGDQALSMLGTDRDIPCYPFSKLYRAELFTQLRFPAFRRAEDVRLLPGILSVSGKISLLSRVIYYYYQRNTSAAHSSDDEYIQESVSGALFVTRFLLDRNLMENARIYYCSAICQALSLTDTKWAADQISRDFSREEQKLLRKDGGKPLLFLKCLRFPSVCKGLRFLKQMHRRIKGV